MFIVDGSHGRLFNVSDETTGIIFSVNDAAGLPIVEVDSTSGYDKVSIGEFGTNALVVSGNKVGIGTDNPSVPLEVTGNIGCNALSAGVGIELHTSSTNNFYLLKNTSTCGQNTGPNKDIVFQVSDGSLSEILRLKGSTQTVNLNGKLKLTEASNEFIMSDGSLRIDIDNNNDETDRAFLISKHNAATELMRVQEDGLGGYLWKASVDAYLHLSNSAEINQKNSRKTWSICLENRYT